jgi:hypothetical protein
MENEMKQVATNNNGEPAPFSLTSDFMGHGVASDTYSFWDQTSDELLAKGNGGMRQMYNYTPANAPEEPSRNGRMTNNQTQPSSQEGVFYRTGRVVVPELQLPTPHRHSKIGGDVTLESLQQKRNEEIQGSMPPMIHQLNNAIIPSEFNVRPPGSFQHNNSQNVDGQNSLEAYMPKLNPDDAREMLFGKRPDDRGKPVTLSSPYLVNI